MASKLIPLYSRLNALLKCSTAKHEIVFSVVLLATPLDHVEVPVIGLCSLAHAAERAPISLCDIDIWTLHREEKGAGKGWTFLFVEGFTKALDCLLCHCFGNLFGLR